MQLHKPMTVESLKAPFTKMIDKNVKAQPTLNQFVVRADPAVTMSDSKLASVHSPTKKRSDLPWETTNLRPLKNAKMASGSTTDSKGKGKAPGIGSLNVKQQIVLSSEQREVLKTVVDGEKNVFFTGSAGKVFPTTHTIE